MKEKTKIITMAVILSLIITAHCFAGDKTEATNSAVTTQKSLKNIKWLVFSHTEHQAEREMIIKANEKEIDDAEKADGKKIKVFIALKDIDADNTDEIFTYFGYSAFCAAKGNCTLEIYKTIQNKLEKIGPTIVPSIPIDRPGHHNLIGILNTQTLNHADILIGNILCRWTGDRYEADNK